MIWEEGKAGSTCRKEERSIDPEESAAGFFRNVYNRSVFCSRITAALYETIITASQESKRNVFIMVYVLQK